MEPTSLQKTKIVSLHLQSCSGYCPNAAVCYHQCKTKITGKVQDSVELRRAALDSGAKVHESICEISSYLQASYYIKILKKNPNYNITISADRAHYFCSNEEFVNQIQVSVYSLPEIKQYKDYQKLYLVKDHTTFGEFRSILFGSTAEETGRLHFLFDQEFIKHRSIPDLVAKFQESKNKLITLDTCFSSWLINGHCPYDDNTYVDINFDATVRKCPYENNGTWFEDISGKNLETAFKISYEPRCAYKKIFKGEKDGKLRKDSSNKDRVTDNGIRSSTGHRRGLSLRS